MVLINGSHSCIILLVLWFVPCIATGVLQASVRITPDGNNVDESKMAEVLAHQKQSMSEFNKNWEKLCG